LLQSLRTTLVLNPASKTCLVFTEPCGICFFVGWTGVLSPCGRN
jgi:hypothetical protein